MNTHWPRARTSLTFSAASGRNSALWHAPPGKTSRLTRWWHRIKLGSSAPAGVFSIRITPSIHTADQSLRPDDGQVYCRFFIEQSIFCYINGQHKQYLLVDTRFNYIFHLDFQEHVLIKVLKPRLSGASGAGSRKVYFPDFSKDIFLEVQNDKCS